MEAVSGEAADINARERMNFASNSVLGKTPKFVDLGISPAHRADKLNSTFAPATRDGGLMNNSDWLTSRNRIAEVTKGRVSEVQAHSDYTLKSEFETRSFFCRKIFKLLDQIKIFK